MENVRKIANLSGDEIVSLQIKIASMIHGMSFVVSMV